MGKGEQDWKRAYGRREESDIGREGSYYNYDKIMKCHSIIGRFRRVEINSSCNKINSNKKRMMCSRIKDVR